MLTVLSPLDQTGWSARLIAGSSAGATPLTYQYSGRHSSQENWVVSLTEYAAEVVMGRIQVGAVPGGSAQVMVPACWAPVAAAGSVPNPPPAPVAGLPPLLCPQAASTVLLVSARTAIMTPERSLLMASAY